LKLCKDFNSKYIEYRVNVSQVSDTTREQTLSGKTNAFAIMMSAQQTLKLILSGTMLFNMFEIVVLDEFFHSFALFEGPSTACHAVWVLLIVEGCMVTCFCV